MARLTVSQVAEISGVSVRTLHYYDEIGLLKPTDVGANGYRYYDRPDLLRLQQILFYRQLGLTLEKVRETLDAPDFDLGEALKAHRAHLVEEVGRQNRLIRTIDETLKDLNGEDHMSDEDTFKGFSPEKQAEYEDYLTDRYGQQAQDKIDQSKARVGKMSKAEMAAIQAEGEQVNRELADAVNSGETQESELVQGLIARHHAWVSHFWTPDAEAYAGLGQLYLDHPDFRSYYDKYDTRLVEFLAGAMKVYAERELS